MTAKRREPRDQPDQPLRMVPRPTVPCAYEAGETQLGDKDARDALIMERRRAHCDQDVEWAVTPGSWLQTPTGYLRGPAPVTTEQVPRWRLAQLAACGLVSRREDLAVSDDDGTDDDKGPAAA